MLLRRASFVAVLTALLMAFTVPTEAQAQQETQQPTFEDLVAAVNNAGAEAENLGEATPEEVRAVSVEEVLQGAEADVDALNEAISENEQDIAALRSTLSENEELSSALEGSGVATSDVIAVESNGGGEVVVYYQSQQ